MKTQLKAKADPDAIEQLVWQLRPESEGGNLEADCCRHMDELAEKLAIARGALGCYVLSPFEVMSEALENVAFFLCLDEEQTAAALENSDHVLGDLCGYLAIAASRGNGGEDEAEIVAALRAEALRLHSEHLAENGERERMMEKAGRRP